MIKTTFFFEHYKQTKKLRSYWKWIMIIFFISWIIFCFYQTLYPLNPEGSFLFWQNLKKLFTFSNADSKYPDFSIVQLSWKMLKLSVNYTILGTSIGFLLAFLLAPFCVLKLFSKFIAYTGKALFLFARCFPILVIIYIIQKGFSNTTAITLILLWVTQLWSVKYLTDIYQNTSLNLYNQMLQSGFSRLRAFWVGVFWQSKNKVFMIYLYALETNLRWATVLGFLGIAGIGQLINQNIPNHFENLGIPLLFLFGVIIILECLLYFFNNFILICKSRDLKKNLKKENDILILNKRKIIKNIFYFYFFFEMYT